MSKYLPLNNNLLIKVDPIEEQVTESGFILSGKAVERERVYKGEILCGNGDIAPGEHVVFNPLAADFFKEDGEEFAFVSPAGLVAKILH